MKRVTVLGGYGIFGARISAGIAMTHGLRLRIAGRDRDRGGQFAERVGADFQHCELNNESSLHRCIEESDLVIHTAGPFQGKDYQVAQACAERGIHYLDIADARDFVCGIKTLDREARDRGVVVGSGASSLPTITYALVKELSPQFSKISSIQIALSPGNQNPRGGSTIGAILSYLGHPIPVWIEGSWIKRYGWKDCLKLEFPPNVGVRNVYNCDVPDLELLPNQWAADTVRVHAGLELNIFNIILSTLATLRRFHLVPNLRQLAPLFLRLSMILFNWGSKNGSLAVWVRGRSQEGEEIERKIAIITDDDGPAIPSCPAILLARKILIGPGLPSGAYPCVGHLSLDEILTHLATFDIWCSRDDGKGGWSPPLRDNLGARTG